MVINEFIYGYANFAFRRRIKLLNSAKQTFHFTFILHTRLNFILTEILTVNPLGINRNWVPLILSINKQSTKNKLKIKNSSNITISSRAKIRNV